MSHWVEERRGEGTASPHSSRRPLAGKAPAKSTGRPAKSTGRPAEFTGRLVGLDGRAPKIVLILLANNRPFSKSELRRLTGMAYRTISQCLQQLEEEGAVTEVGEQGWRISEAWSGRFKACLLGKNGDGGDRPADRPVDLYDRPADPFDQSADRFDRPVDRFDQSADPFDQSADPFDHSLRSVVVEDRIKNKDKQQQSFRSPDRVTAGMSPGKAPRDGLDHAGDRDKQRAIPSDQPADPFDQSTGHFVQAGEDFGQPGRVRDHSFDTPLDQPEQEDGRSEKLADYLQQAGIVGPAYKKLLERPALLLDPAPVLGWWWYALTQGNVRNPTALAANYLLAGNAAPTGFVELVRFWPRLTAEQRLATEEMIERNWGAQEMVYYWSEKYPEVTMLTFIALKELYFVDPGVLYSSE